MRAEGIPGEGILFVPGKPAVIDHIGVPHPHQTFLRQLFQHQIMAAAGPVALVLAYHRRISLLHIFPGLPPVISFLKQVKSQLGGCVLKQACGGAVGSAVPAVPGSHFRRCQFVIRHVAGEHGQGSNAAAVGGQLVIPVHGTKIILL